jgi:hypothetical protein
MTHSRDQQQAEDGAVHELNAWVHSLHTTEGDKAWDYFTQPLSAAIVSARHAVFNRAGFRFEYPGSNDSRTKWLNNGDIVKAKFSPYPALTHSAVCYHRAHWRGTGWWINGRAIDAPCDDDGFPMCAYFGRWVDDGTFQVQVGLPDHPLSGPILHDPLGELRGLLFVNARTYKTMLVLPREDEHWERPRARRCGQQIHIYLYKHGMTDHRIVRTVEF